MIHLKKVLVWRAISVIITLIITWAWTGDIRAASGLTILLQVALLGAHWAFEDWWLKVTVDKLLGLAKKRPDGRKET